MLKINIRRILDTRGITTHYTWLVENGFVPQTARSWLTYEVGYLKPSHVERLCYHLNCTPNDLFEWHDDGKIVLHDTHALRALKREAAATDVQSALKSLPLDKLEKLGEMIASLNNNGYQED